MTVIHRQSVRRSGITLTEILIAIMIMGIGFVSVATLFPIGIMRMRDATRASRSTLLAETAANEVNARDLLNGPSFLSNNLGWYTEFNAIPFDNAVWPYDPTQYAPSPWSKDLNQDFATDQGSPGVYAAPFQPGLPIAYDPSFWSTVHYNTFDIGNPAVAVTPDNNLNDRFGSGIGLIRLDSNGNAPPAHGLRRITNFRQHIPSADPFDVRPYWPLTYALPGQSNAFELVGDIFASTDDPVFADTDTGDSSGSPLVPVDFNPLPPDPATGELNYEPQRTWDFTWMVTARQASAGDSSIYEADIVVFHKRPIGFEIVPAPYAPGGQAVVPSGERTVEAVWGHTNSPGSIAPLGNGYSTADDRSVLLRWNLATPDPLVRVGDWIADVTYERFQARSLSNYPVLQAYRGQRIHWYRIEQVSEVEADPAFPDHRRLIVRVDTPVKSKTRLTTSGANVVPVVPEAALLNPYVVNVYSTLLYSRQ